MSTENTPTSPQEPKGPPAIARLQVTYCSEVLGNGVFWEGPPDRIEEIHNVVAQDLAQRVLRSQRPQATGMWRVMPLDAQGQELGGSVDKLISFMRANARAVRPGRPIQSPYAALPKADRDPEGPGEAASES